MGIKNDDTPNGMTAAIIVKRKTCSLAVEYQIEKKRSSTLQNALAPPPKFVSKYASV